MSSGVKVNVTWPIVSSTLMNVNLCMYEFIRRPGKSWSRVQIAGKKLPYPLIAKNLFLLAPVRKTT